jgi:hypothetical protein
VDQSNKYPQWRNLGTTKPGLRHMPTGVRAEVIAVRKQDDIAAAFRMIWKICWSANAGRRRFHA